MNVALSCHHGHRMEVRADSTDKLLVCHRCGSVRIFRAHNFDRTNEAINATQDSRDESSSTEEQAEDIDYSLTDVDIDDDAVDNEQASLMQTLDYSPPTKTPHNSPATPTSPNLSSGIRMRRSSSNSSANKTFEPPKLDGYEIIEELGRGGMGVVYRARNAALGREVALKTLQSMSPENLQRFKREFRTLADLAHPNLACLYELLSDGETWCFSMEVLQGVDFLEYVWSGFESLGAKTDGASVLEQGERLTLARLARLEDALKQLTIGLDALHAAGILHSDLKPSNVLVTTDGRLVILDFGLAVPIAQLAHCEGFVGGTPRYMSPEQGQGKVLSEASDWYSVGVMLYEILTGRLPFEGPSVEVLAAKNQETPIDCSQLQAGNPARLNELCMALLDRDPIRRPTAPLVLECLDATEAGVSLMSLRRASVVQSVDLVGRAGHLQLLQDAFAKVAAGDTLSVFVHGQSGMGKSVLVRSFLDGLVRRGEAVVLTGRCYEQESVPFKALDSLIDSLAVYLETLPSNVIASVMPRDRLALSRVFPVIDRFPESALARYPTIANADRNELRQRAMTALRELLQRLAIIEPLVLYVDDLQWGDVDSAGLLADLVRPPDAPQMLVLGSYRSEDRTSSLCLRALAKAYTQGQHLPRCEELTVESLTAQEASQLALRLLGNLDAHTRAIADRIAYESRGWPFFVWELCQHVQEDAAIAHKSLELDEVIWSRIQQLPKSTLRLLELIAVAGQPLPATEAYIAAEATTQGPALLAQLRTNNFIRTAESAEQGTLVETYHDRIRETIIKHLSTETMRADYLSLALMTQQVSGLRAADMVSHLRATTPFAEPVATFKLEKKQWQRVFDVAYFFDAANEPGRALPFALVAAEQAWSQNAFDVAVQQYEIAKKGAYGANLAIRFRIAEGLGDVLMMRADYERAQEQFDLARSLTTSDVALARIDGKRGFVAFKQGDMTSSAKHFEQALCELGNPPPRNRVTRLFRLLVEACKQGLHSYFPSRFRERRPAGTQQCNMDLLRARVYDGLGYAYWFTQGPIPTLWTHLRHMNLAERYPPSQELGRAYALHAIIITAVPLAARGVAYAEKAYKIHGDLGDRLGQGKARSFQTFSLLALGRFKEGVQSGREAVELLRQAGDVWEANMARIILSQPLYFLGDLEGSHREAKQAYEIGLETGDHSAVAIALYFWVPSAPHRVPEGVLQSELERPREDPLSCTAVIQGRGLELLLREDRPREAAEMIHRSLQVAKDRGLRNPCVFAGATWEATALRIVAEREPPGSRRQQALRKAKRAVRTALKITRKFQACRAQAFREAALIALLEDDPQRVKKYLEASRLVAVAQEARYEYAQTLLAEGTAGTRYGWPNAGEQILAARSILDGECTLR